MALTWRLSDGTTIALGGTVEGASLVAQEIRRGLAERPRVPEWGDEPCREIALDPYDPMRLDQWLTILVGRQVRCHGVKISIRERPDGIAELPGGPRPSEGSGAVL